MPSRSPQTFLAPLCIDGWRESPALAGSGSCGHRNRRVVLFCYPATEFTMQRSPAADKPLGVFPLVADVDSSLAVHPPDSEQPDRSARMLCPHSRSEEHTSELQSPCNLVCRLLLEKKKKTSMITLTRHCVT